MSLLLHALTAADTLSANGILEVNSVPVQPGQAITLGWLDDDGKFIPEATWYAPLPAQAAYTDVRARAAQLNRVAAANTPTALLTAEAPTDYGTIYSGSIGVDPTGAVTGKVVFFTIGPGGTAPGFGLPSNANQQWDFSLATFVAGATNRYAIRVFPDRIEVINIAR